MDDHLIAAFSVMVAKYHCSADDILECPILRQAYLTIVQETSIGNLPERAILHKLTSLRKRRKLPRKRDLLAVESPK